MANVLQPFVPQQVTNLPKPSLWLVHAEMRGTGTENLAAASTKSPRYTPRPFACTALGPNAAGITAALRIEVESVALLLRVAEAKLASLLTAPDPSGGRGSGATGQSPDKDPRAGQLTARTARTERTEEGTPVADYGDHQRRLDLARDTAGPGPAETAAERPGPLDGLSGAAPAGPTLTITLYEFLEDAPSRNRPPPQQSAGTAVVSLKPPMASRPAAPPPGRPCWPFSTGRRTIRTRAFSSRPCT